MGSEAIIAVHKQEARSSVPTSCMSWLSACDAASWISALDEARLAATLDTVRLATFAMCGPTHGRTSHSTPSASRVTLELTSFRHGTNRSKICTQQGDASASAARVPAPLDLKNSRLFKALPYLTLPFGAGVLPPSTEASSGPNAHPRINPKVIETFYRFLQT